MPRFNPDIRNKQFSYIRALRSSERLIFLNQVPYFSCAMISYDKRNINIPWKSARSFQELTLTKPIKISIFFLYFLVAVLRAHFSSQRKRTSSLSYAGRGRLCVSPCNNKSKQFPSITIICPHAAVWVVICALARGLCDALLCLFHYVS